MGTSESIFLIGSDGSLERIGRQEYDAEDRLQLLLETHHDLLPGELIDREEPPRWLLVKREMGIPDARGASDRWSVDHLFLDQHGTPTFVEVKRSTDSRIRREVVGQLLDYAANASEYFPVSRIREALVGRLGEQGAEAAVIELLGGEQDDGGQVEDFWSIVEEKLRSGSLRLLFVADELPRELRRIIEFLNQQMDRVEVLGVELPQYVGQNVSALVPRVVGQTEATREAKSRGRTGTSSTPAWEEFIAGLESRGLCELFERLRRSGESAGLSFKQNRTSFSLCAPELVGGKGTAAVFQVYRPHSNGQRHAHVLCDLRTFSKDLAGRDPVRERLLQVSGAERGGDLDVKLYALHDRHESAVELLDAVIEEVERRAARP